VVVHFFGRGAFFLPLRARRAGPRPQPAPATGVERAMDQPPLDAGHDASLPGLPPDLMGAIVDLLTPVDVACLSLTCRTLREATKALAPATTGLCVTHRAAAWLLAPGRLACVTELCLYLGIPRNGDALGESAAAVGAALVAGAAPRLRSLMLHCGVSLSAPHAGRALPLDVFLDPRATSLRHLAVHGAAPDPQVRARAALARLDALALGAGNDSLSDAMLSTPRLHDLDRLTLTPRLRSLVVWTVCSWYLHVGLQGDEDRVPFDLPSCRLPPSLTHLGWVRWHTGTDGEPTAADLLAALPALRSLSWGGNIAIAHGICRDRPPWPVSGFDLTLHADRLFATAVPVCPWADSITSLDLNLWNTLEMDLLPLAAAPRLASLTLRCTRRVRGLPPTLTRLALQDVGEGSDIRERMRLEWPDGGLPRLGRLEVAAHDARVDLWSADLAAPLDAADAEEAGASLKLDSYICMATGDAAAAGWPAWLAAALARARARAPAALSSFVPKPVKGERKSRIRVQWPVRVVASGTDGFRDAFGGCRLKVHPRMSPPPAVLPVWPLPRRPRRSGRSGGAGKLRPGGRLAARLKGSKEG